MKFKKEMQLGMISLFPNPPDFLLWQANRHCRYKRNDTGHAQSCACVLGVGVGGTGQAYHKYSGRGLSNRGKMWAPPLVPATSAYAAAYAEDSAVCNSCKMQGAAELKGAGGERRERWVCSRSALASESGCGSFKKEDAQQGRRERLWAGGAVCCVALSIPVLLSWTAGEDPKSLPGKRETTFPVLTASRCASVSWMLGPMP